jgi:hypothetical protein
MGLDMGLLNAFSMNVVPMHDLIPLLDELEGVFWRGFRDSCLTVTPCVWMDSSPRFHSAYFLLCQGSYYMSLHSKDGYGVDSVVWRLGRSGRDCVTMKLQMGSNSSVVVFVTVFAIAVAGPTLNGVQYDVLGPFPQGNREQADPLTAFGDPFVLHAVFAANRSRSVLFPSELADGGNITWSTASADNTGTVNFNFTNVRFDFLNAAFGPFLLGMQGWAFGVCPRFQQAPLQLRG